MAKINMEKVNNNLKSITKIAVTVGALELMTVGTANIIFGKKIIKGTCQIIAGIGYMAGYVLIDSTEK